MDWLDWILLIVRVAVVFVVLLVVVMLVVWAERKVVADMQMRIGPKRAGPFGVLITLADGIKLFFKEGITPTHAERPVFGIAPIASLIPAILAFAVVPFGTGIELFGREIPFQIADLNVGILFFLAMGSLAIYGIVLGGWASGSAYPLLGGIRSSAQMISYEIGMGLAVAAVVMYSGTMRMSELVAAQDKIWNIVPQFPAFLIFGYAALAESNRPPFDLPEAESELVAGFAVEYSSTPYLLFMLGEYVAIVTMCAVGTILFLGGWLSPIPFPPFTWVPGVIWFVLKASFLFFMIAMVKAFVPRYRYDQLMRLGWKVFLPLSLASVVVVAAVLKLTGLAPVP